jgi:hypothetical protein
MIFTIFRYLVLDSESYQSKKFRLPNWEELQVSWINYFVHGFVPWTWDDLYIENLFKNCLDVMNSNIYGPLMITLLITLGGIAKIEFDARRLEKLSFLKKEYVGLLLFLMCLFSYLPYLFVSDGTGSWRTHFLAAPWNSLLVSFFLMKIYLRQFSRGYLNLFKIIAVFSGAAIFIFLGSVANLYQQLEYSVRWNDHRNFYGSLLQEVPGFLQGTSLLVTNVPDSIGLEKGFCPEARRDIFEDVYWLNANLEAYYPDKFDSVDYIKLADRDKFLRSYHEGDNSFIWQNHEYKLNQTIVVEFEQLGKTRIVNYPELVLALGKTSINYNPQSRILSGKSMLWTDFNLRFKHD